MELRVVIQRMCARTMFARRSLAYLNVAAMIIAFLPKLATLSESAIVLMSAVKIWIAQEMRYVIV